MCKNHRRLDSDQRAELPVSPVIVERTLAESRNQPSVLLPSKSVVPSVEADRESRHSLVNQIREANQSWFQGWFKRK